MQNDRGVVISSSPSSGSFSAPTDASPVRQFFRSKWVRLILVLDVIAIIAVIVFVIFNQTKTAIINFSVAPVDATITMNGQGNYHNGSYQVHPGTYDVTISHDGLDPKTFTLELKPDYSTTLTAFLKGENNNFDFYTYKANYDSLQQLISIATKDSNTTTDQDPSAEQFVADYQKSYNLYQTILPINYYTVQETTSEDGSPWYTTTNMFDIEASSGCQKTICLKITVERITGGEDFAKKVLQDKGFDLNLCEVKYEEKTL